MQMFNAEHLQEKWAPLLDYDGAEKITDSHVEWLPQFSGEPRKIPARRASFLSEDPTNAANAAGASGGFGGSATKTGPVAGFDPVLISLIRRSMPNLVAYDLAGVQPMNGPTGLIFAMRSRYTNQSGTETFFDEVDTAFSGQNDGGDLTQGDTLLVLMAVVLLVSVLPDLVMVLASNPGLAASVASQADILLVRVCTLVTLRTSEMDLVISSTRWHSQSRKSP